MLDMYENVFGSEFWQYVVVVVNSHISLEDKFISEPAFRQSLSLRLSGLPLFFIDPQNTGQEQKIGQLF